MDKTVFIGLGSNLGDREAFLLQALKSLKTFAKNDSWKVSSFYETNPIDAGGSNYLNAVCCFKTDLSPQQLHDELDKCEQAAGRKRLAYNSPRTLDLDLLFYGSEIIDTPKLKVPHPRLKIRAFVLIPLCEIDPEWIHPESQKTSKQLLLDLPSFEMKGVTKYESDSYFQAASS